MFLGICVVFLHDTCSQYVFLAHDTNTYLTTLSFGVGEQVSNRLRWAVTHARVYFDLWRNTSDLKFVKHRLCLGIGSACTTSWPTMYLFCISQFLDCRYLWELVLHTQMYICAHIAFMYIGSFPLDRNAPQWVYWTVFIFRCRFWAAFVYYKKHSLGRNNKNKYFFFGNPENTNASFYFMCLTSQ